MIPQPCRTCRRCGLPCKGHPAPGYGLGTCQVSLVGSHPAPSDTIDSDTMVERTHSDLKETRNEPCYNCGQELTQTTADIHQCYEDWSAMTTSSVTSTPSPSPTPTATTHELSAGTLATYEPPNISPHAVPNTAASAFLTSAAFHSAFLPTTSEQESESIGQRLARMEKDVPLVYRCWYLRFPRMSHDTIVSVLEKNLRKHKAPPFPDGWVSSVLSKYNLGPDSSTVSQLF